MSETTNEINYQDYVMKPDSDVLVPLSTYVAINNLVQAVEREHSRVYRTDKFSFFNRKTHEKLSNKNRVKMDPEKLHRDYYENIDLDATAKTSSVLRDDLGSAALQLIAEFRNVFTYNIDQGNGMLRSELPTAPGPVSAPSKLVSNSDDS